jgi:hypothetical protein
MFWLLSLVLYIISGANLCVRVLGAGRQLAKFMELQSLNDLGYPKRYIRTLQISEVVKSMKDLMNFTGEHKVGPLGKSRIPIYNILLE